MLIGLGQVCTVALFNVLKNYTALPPFLFFFLRNTVQTQALTTCALHSLHFKLMEVTDLYLVKYFYL